MAEAAFSSVVVKLGELLILQEATFLRGVKDEVEWLHDELWRMQCFLKDADAKRRKGDERVKNWVREVRDVAYQAEDAVDTFMLKVDKRRQQQRTGGFSSLLMRYACIPFELSALHDTGVEIARIRSKIRAISDSRQAHGIVNLSAEKSSIDDDGDGCFHAWRQLSPHLDDDTVVVGFDSHKQAITRLLLDPGVNHRRVISIVGMGGLGKTTLATRVFNSSEVKSHFGVVAWVTVSQNYRAIDLLKSIWKTVTGKSAEMMEESEVKSELYDFLRGKRYFVVMDDVWMPEMWQQIKVAFPNEKKNGSRLLFTTRSMDVAKAADPQNQPYHLPLLTSAQSRELFLRRVFPTSPDDEPSCPKELEGLAEELVKRCGGLPLAVGVLGGLVSMKDPTVKAWREVADSMDWDATRDGKECLQVLALSYNDLPNPCLKSCFLYIGAFPEDFKIRTSELINLWIAEGFIAYREKQTMEETARHVLDELVQRCMVQVVDKSLTDGTIKSIRIHDLFRDLCISEAKEEDFFRIQSSNSDTQSSVSALMRISLSRSRRLVIFHSIAHDEFPHSASKARSMLHFRSDFGTEMIHSMCRFKLLRVIYLHFTSHASFHKRTFPQEITSLIHLRYIKLVSKDTSLNYLPNSIGNLCNLQTLDVRHTDICMLPRTLWKIQTLRHIRGNEIKGNVGSLSIGNAKGLQTLKSVYGGLWIQTELAKLSNLRKLDIRHVSSSFGGALGAALLKLDRLVSLSLQSVEFEFDAILPALSNLFHLRKLSLSGPMTDFCGIPDGITSLSLRHCSPKEDPMLALGRLPSLVVLKLDHCKLPSEEVTCLAGSFACLQCLSIENLQFLAHWRLEAGAMPNLAQLTIVSCRQLSKLPEGLQRVDSLQKLVVSDMLPGFVKELDKDSGCDWYKIQHIPDTKITETGP